MTIWISTEHNEDRLTGTLNNLSRGPNPAKLKFYSGTRPAGGGAVTTLICTVTLQDPAGTVASNKLTLASPADALVVADGVATWARFETGEGNPSMDWDVVEEGAPDTTNKIVLESTTLYAGGGIRIISAEIG